MKWKMRRLMAWEHPQLWHLQVSQSNGYYRTACGLRFGIAGSAIDRSSRWCVCSMPEESRRRRDAK